MIIRPYKRTNRDRPTQRLARHPCHRYNTRMAPSTIEFSDELEMRIRDALAPLHPETVILFGSYAWGQPTEDSDIDLYVVTQDASEIRRNRQQLRPPDHERGGPAAMKRASGQWLSRAIPVPPKQLSP